MHCWHAPAEGLIAALTASQRSASSHKLAWRYRFKCRPKLPWQARGAKGAL